MANCETTARVMREEEARLEEVYNRWDIKEIKTDLKFEFETKEICVETVFLLQAWRGGRESRQSCCNSRGGGSKVKSFLFWTFFLIFLILNFLFDISELYSFAENYSWHEIFKPPTFIFRLEQELVQKEAADAAMAREKEVLKLIKINWNFNQLI